MTWNQTGSKQVAVVGMDEKQAFTLLVSVAADGTILPFQAIYQGKMKLSLPVATLRRRRVELVICVFDKLQGS
jgi:hypothetical protein